MLNEFNDKKFKVKMDLDNWILTKYSTSKQSHFNALAHSTISTEC